MIVRPAASGCVLITQPDHAQLARRIMVHCVLLVENPRREAILRAIGDHDDGWAATDAEPAVDAHTGGVVDFISAPLRVRPPFASNAELRAAWARAMTATIQGEAS